MPTWLTGTVQWLHVLFGIFWIGSVLSLTFVVVPALGRAAQPGKQTFVGMIQQRVHQLLPPVAVATILLGLLRGTIFGPVTSLQVVLGTAYGLTWTAALIFSIATLIAGSRGMGGGFIQLATMVLTASDESRAAYDAQLRKIRVAGYITIAGFLATFSCMILMRFGY
ncbi:MAG TPA: hypothetical protein VF807_03590, partial [Ktedonobacterales bacterium]